MLALQIDEHTVNPNRIRAFGDVFNALIAKKSEKARMRSCLFADKTAPNSADLIKRILRGSPFGLSTVVFTAGVRRESLCN